MTDSLIQHDILHYIHALAVHLYTHSDNPFAISTQGCFKNLTISTQGCNNNVIALTT